LTCKTYIQFITFSFLFLCQCTPSQPLADQNTPSANTPTVNIPESSPDTLYFYGYSVDPENRFGTINEKGEVRIETNLPFDIRMYAKIERKGKSYLIDTKGTEYRFTNNIHELDETIQAFDFS